jgi:simple sugar transport system ATP-binding protein
VCERGSASAAGEVRLAIDGLCRPTGDIFGTALDNIQLHVRAGEIVGIAGVSGNGQQELLGVLSGEAPIENDALLQICGSAAGRAGPAARRRLGLGFVPEERLGRGAVPQMSLSQNALLTAHASGMLHHGLIRFDAARAFTDRCIAAYRVKCSGAAAQASSLSGGNLQKFIVGREIMQAPRVLVVAQPTWGVDVGAAAFIRQALIDLRDAGAAVLVVSEELDELFEISDRLAVMAGGRLSPLVPARETSVEKIGMWMSGMWPGAADDAHDGWTSNESDDRQPEVLHVAQA